ncbi:High mobility group B protein 15, partial [Mucuna pruriens]
MASTSCVGKSSLPMKDAASNYRPYPFALAKYEEVVDNPQLFMFTLEKLHVSMGTKFMIPIVGGRELDLHRLFVEVTSRGGIAKIIRERKWKDVTSVFNFPSTATNASFVLRKYYASLLYHYEQIYYFKAREWDPTAPDVLQNQSTLPVPPPPKMQFVQPSPEIQPAVFQQSNVNAAKLPEVMAASSAGSPVIGVIDGKFESGYLVTVTIGSEKLKGVLYQAPQNSVLPASHHSALANNNNASASLGVHRRRRRKKSEIKRRDPAHPKPNRSGYNFFFAEQHARLKLLHHGKDREISRMIGELWTKLKESEKTVYQEKAMKDKERYRAEMEDYREKLKMGQVISHAVPLQQRLPEPDTEMLDDIKIDEAEADSAQTPEESSSGGSDYEDYNNKGSERGFDMDALPVIGLGAEPSYLGSEDKSSKGGSPVIGVIDEKFESGYLVTVTIGSEKLRGVLYHSASANNKNVSASSGVHRGRKKSEIKVRDPSHPKHNRSAYNFFFAEQHARLKLLHHANDRGISGMIAQLWTKITQSEKMVYEEKAMKDKERYRAEMEDYGEKLKVKVKMGQVITDAVPLQQLPPGGSEYEEYYNEGSEIGFDMGVGASTSYLGSEDESSKGEIFAHRFLMII